MNRFLSGLSRQSRNAVVATVTFTVLVSLIVTVEAPFIPGEWRSLFVTVKLGFAVSALFLIPALIRDPYGLIGNLGMTAVMILYTLFGAVFRPLYCLAFIQCALALSFLFAIPRKLYPMIVIVWAVGVGFAQNFGFERGYWNYASETLGDEITIMIVFGVVAILVHRYVLAERVFREQSLRRFGVIGKQSALIIHDIKSLMAAPKVHLHALEKRLQHESDRELLEIVRSLDEDLTRVKDLTVELNRLSSHQLSPNDEASVLHCIERGRALLGSRARSITWDFPDPGSDRLLRISDPRLSSVFLHLFTNAWEAFERNSVPVERRQVFVIWEKNELVIQDTAGGIPPSILRLLQRKQFSSGRIGGSGLGTFLVDDTIHEIGGHVHFQNVGGGARVTLSIPKRAFIRRSEPKDRLLSSTLRES